MSKYYSIFSEFKCKINSGWVLIFKYLYIAYAGGSLPQNYEISFITLFEFAIQDVHAVNVF